jgi:hypothetical protein
MLSNRLRAGLAAAATLGAAFAVAAPATAAGATVTVEPQVALSDEQVRVSGTCAATSKTAVVTITQDGRTLSEDAAPVTAALSYSVMLDLAGAETGPAAASVECFNYPDRAPVGSGAAGFLILADDFADAEEVDVAVSPGRVALGGTFTVTAQCPEGSGYAEVYAGNDESDDPFFAAETVPGRDGTVSVTGRVVAADGVEPTAGPASVFVFCAEDDALEAGPTGVGFAEFAIVATPAAPSAPAVPVAASPSPAIPVSATPAAAAAAPASAAPAVTALAHTGSQAQSLAALGGSLLLAGSAAIAASRVRRQS